MKERPILFSAPMVRAILAGAKTQTRRVLKKGWPMTINGELANRCPYGQLGDQLWVRETWGYFDPDSSGDDPEPKNDEGGSGPLRVYAPELMQKGHPLREFWRRRIAYAATWQEPKYGSGPDAPTRWRPSIHMPRWASRITLEVTAVRVQWLQDISEADSLAEGIVRTHDGFGLPDGKHFHAADPRQSYLGLWEAINGPGSVEANPLVWVLSFRQIEAATSAADSR